MRILILSLLVVIADQATKLIVKGIKLPSLGISIEGLQLGTSRPVWGDFLRLTYIENAGMAFGIDIGGKLFFSIFSTIASLGILWYLYKARAESLAFRTSLALILGGAVGNLIDRVFYGIVFDEGPFFYGKVVDFIDADFFNVNLFGFHMSRWPIFNIADASVTCGVILLLLVHRHSTREEPFADTSPLVGSPGSESEVVTARAVVQDPSQSPASSESSQS